MQAIERAMQIIRVMIKQDPNRFYSITELAEECNLPTSTLHRILKSMIQLEMIQQDKKSKLYHLGTIWLEYGLIVYDTLDYVSLLRPQLESLMKTVEATVYLSKPLGKESIIIERIDCINQSIRVHDKLGLRKPLHIGAANRTMLAHMSSEFVQEIINEAISENEKNSFHQKLEEIKVNGYELTKEERIGGITTIASPIINHYGGVVGAISIKLNAIDLTDENLKTIINEVINTANNISWKMGY
ncbi:IclR family transcriptional regulator [Ureibacillus sp. NPDC094379]